MGGQTCNNIALPLHRLNVNIQFTLMNTGASIRQAEKQGADGGVFQSSQSDLGFKIILDSYKSLS
jgi:hypothetical protein